MCRASLFPLDPGRSRLPPPCDHGMTRINGYELAPSKTIATAVEDASLQRNARPKTARGPEAGYIFFENEVRPLMEAALQKQWNLLGASYLFPPEFPKAGARATKLMAAR